MDIAVLSVLCEGIIRRPLPQMRRLARIRAELKLETTGSVELPPSAFLQTKSPAALLAAMGLHSYINNNWRINLFHLIRNKYFQVETPAPPANLRAFIAEELTRIARI